MAKVVKKKPAPAGKAKTESKSEQRGHIRFEPDLGTLAWIDPRVDAVEFDARSVALVSEESSSGCGLVMRSNAHLNVGAKCRVKVGNGAPLAAEVRWRADLDAQYMRVGLMYLE